MEGKEKMDMNRRTFCKVGAAAGIATTGIAGTVSCGSTFRQSTLAQRIARIDAESYFSDFDSSMSRIGRFACDEGNPCDVFDPIARSAIRSLNAATMFRDMPLEVKLHPQMQRRIFSHIGEMDNSVFGDSEKIASSQLLSDPRLVAALQTKGSNNPGLKFLERFDMQAAQGRLSRRKRYRLRKIGLDAVDRMRHQPPEVVFGDAHEKVKQMRRMAEMCGSVAEADKRLTVMREGRDAYDKRQREIANILEYYDQTLIASNDPKFIPDSDHEREKEVSSSAAPDPKGNAAKNCDCTTESEHSWKEGFEAGKDSIREQFEWQAKFEGANGLIAAGAWTLGVGLTMGAIGAGLVAIDPIVTLVVSGTVGGLLLITGLIIMAVGGIKKSTLKAERAALQRSPLGLQSP